MRRMMVVSGLLCAGFLTACGTTPEPIRTTEYIEATVPGVLTDCKPVPAIPDPPVTDKKVGRYIVDLIDAHDDCYGKNRKIGELFGPDIHSGP